MLLHFDEPIERADVVQHHLVDAGQPRRQVDEIAQDHLEAALAERALAQDANQRLEEGELELEGGDEGGGGRGRRADGGEAQRDRGVEAVEQSLVRFGRLAGAARRAILGIAAHFAQKILELQRCHRGVAPRGSLNELAKPI